MDGHDFSELEESLADVIDFEEAGPFLEGFTGGLRKLDAEKPVSMGLDIAVDNGRDTYTLKISQDPGNEGSKSQDYTLLVGPNYFRVGRQCPVKQIISDLGGCEGCENTEESLYVALALYALSEVAQASGFNIQREIPVSIKGFDAAGRSLENIDRLQKELHLDALKERFSEYHGDRKFIGYDAETIKRLIVGAAHEAGNPMFDDNN